MTDRPQTPDGGATDPNELVLPASGQRPWPGRLVVIEGPDGSGRSSHIALLTEWLEWRGFAVSTLGLKKSKLLGSDLIELSQRNDLQPLTQFLLYATDLYDQIENRVIPALQAGFVVLADRYVLTLICRALVRKIPGNYLEHLFSLVPEPDLKLRLSLKPELAFDRLMTKQRSLGHSEFGGDLKLSANVFESFLTYQRHLNKHFRRRGNEMGYKKIASNRPTPKVNAKLRKHVGELLGIDDCRYTPSDDLQRIWDL